MKKQNKIKKILKRNIFLMILFFFIIGTVFGAFTSTLINIQTSTGTGSNNSKISFSGGIDAGYYVNDEDNSAIIGNYFEGYYYDNLFGFFKLDWSSNPNDNVRIVGSTSLCSTGYGYKLGGKAYSEISGYIDFNYNSTTFVYFCLDDGKLHGTSYGKYIGFQDFNGIQIGIVVDIVDLIEKVNNDTIFKNDTTSIEKSTTITSEEIETIGGDLIQIDERKESIFYIIK